jgi:hypothetical protein
VRYDRLDGHEVLGGERHLSRGGILLQVAAATSSKRPMRS